MITLQKQWNVAFSSNDTWDKKERSPCTLRREQPLIYLENRFLKKKPSCFGRARANEARYNVQY